MNTHRQFLLVEILIVVVLVLSTNAKSLQVAQGRIVGGQPANDINIPYIVSILYWGFHVCGGSIVNERTVITAAHCVDFTKAYLLKVHAGAKTHSLDEGVVVNVAASHYNTQYSSLTHDYDIGLIRLAEPLTFGDTIRPIHLPTPEDAPLRDGSVATIAGWGDQEFNGKGSEVLRYAMVPIFNQITCNRLLSGAITERMICAGYLEGGVDACQNDSGGPLVVQETLVGIVSFGEGCAFRNRPGVYARVSALLPWVDGILASEYNEVL